MSTEEKEQKRLSRREFVKGAAIGAAGVATAGVLASCGATPTPETVIVKETVEVPKEVIKEVTKEVIKEVNPLIPQTWDYEADVVILGLGLAGAAAAIEAHDKGAKVLVVEKQPHDTHYSNSRMSGGVWHNPHTDGDRNARVEYVQAMMCGVNIPWKIEGEQPHVSRPMAEMFADRMMDNERWLKSMDPELVVDPPAGVASFPTFPFFNEAKYGATVGNRYPDSTNANPDQLAPQRPKLQKASGESMMWAVIEEGIRKKRPAIEILYSTPARRIIQNTNGEIIGVIAEQGGKEIACKAKRAVIVCTGGYEYNVAMRRAFLKGPGVKGWCFYGSPDNTGDGIEMASRVGAGLAKVMKAASRIEIAVPYGRGYDETGLKMGLISTGQAAKNGFMVDNDGKRYADEHKIIDSRRPYRYQFYEEAVHYDMLNMRYPRVPTWLIFDESLRSSFTLTNRNISTAGFGFVPWSKDNMDAINRGWILKADTLAELATKIRADPENLNAMSTEVLVETANQFNAYAAAGEDLEFGRTPSTLGPVETPPFYAVKFYPGGPNTKGSIDADAQRHVLDWEGKPIPRLFTAGEISSVFKFTYQAGGNITECMVCGRLAGENAAALAPWA